jgi:pathogenesis-related protein 1
VALALASQVASGCSDGDAPPDAGLGSGNTMEPPELKGTLSAHNQIRAQVGLPPLVWDPALAAIATAWVTRCVDVEAPLGLVDHNKDRSAGGSYVGENIFGASDSATGATAVSAWAAESANYNYTSNQCTGVCGHYTQLVWRETAKLGCALHVCDNLAAGNTVVCNYAPGGNINNRRPY